MILKPVFGRQSERERERAKCFAAEPLKRRRRVLTKAADQATSNKLDTTSNRGTF
jgi:hypothetical protein